MNQSLTTLLDQVISNPRSWKVLEGRVDEGLTLEETGKVVGGITRERVRQIEKKSKLAMNTGLGLLAPVLSLLEFSTKSFNVKKGTKLGTDGKAERKQLAQELMRILETASYEAKIDDTMRLILFIRASVYLISSERSKGLVQKQWPTLSYLACSLSPSVLQHRRVAKLATHERKLKRKPSYKDLSYQILLEAGKPLHWSAMVERAYNLGRRESFNETPFYNALLSHPKIFVRVGPGEYGLVEWGLKPVDYYVDIIARVLKVEHKPLAPDVIYRKVKSIRLVKKTTITMFLHLHPRFYKSIESTYGLRAWLGPREEQTLRTPRWLVEDQKSLERIEIAREKGYHIEEILRQDMEG